MADGLINFELALDSASAIEIWRIHKAALHVGFTDPRLDYEPVAGGFAISCSREIAGAIASALEEIGDDQAARRIDRLLLQWWRASLN